MTTAKMDRTGTAVPFEVDQQTWKDIDLFDDGRVGPAYSLFNRVKTGGGEEALVRMLRTPSNQRSLLQGRRDTIRFFQEKRVDLRVGREQLKRIEHYLSSGIFLIPDRWLKALLYSLRNQARQSTGHGALINGVRMTVSLLRYLYQLRETWLADDCPAALAQELNELPGLIADQRVSALVMGASRHLRLMDLAWCDHYFRGSGKACLRHLLRLLYEWDVFEAVATVTQQHGLSFPQYDDAPEPCVRAEGLFPITLNGAVPSDLELGKGVRLGLITGASRAGKTSFLKSFGLAVYLAHVGFPVPARSFRTTIFNGLVITIEPPDCLGQGFSRSYAEARRLKEVLSQVKQKRRVMVIFDELFGTHLNDAGGEPLQVIEGLAALEGSLFLLSSPGGDMAESLHANPHIFLACFESEMEGGVPWHSYRLKEGVCNERTGTAWLRQEGILDMLEELQLGRVIN
ncbi:MAG TPA: hypothetical protein VHE54_18580 [Puia sp.]|nr:hypothetical protein [Puia sp.]